MRLGKTIVFAHVAADAVNDGGRVLILAHREELIRQAAAKLESATGLSAAIEKADECAAQSMERVVIGSIQTLLNPVRRDNLGAFSHVIVDECFVAGTMIDGIPIEKIETGDVVSCYDHALKSITYKKVICTMTKRARSICLVKMSDGSTIICTPNHPVWNGEKYVEAAILCDYDMVYEKQHTKTMRDMRNDIHSKILEQKNDTLLQERLCNGGNRQEAEKTGRYLRSVWKAICSGRQKTLSGKQGEDLLLKGMQQGVQKEDKFRNNGDDKPCLRFGSNEEKKPNVKPGTSGKDDSINEGTTISSSDGEWTAYGSPAKIIQRNIRAFVNWVRYGISDKDSIGKGNFRETSKLLQSGYRIPGNETCNRGRRGFSSAPQRENERRFKNEGLRAIRVESVKVYQQGSGSEFEQLCPDGLVYNLEVEECNNYFANGILVHNCHHIVSPSFLEVMAQWVDAKVLGVTATADRADKKELGVFFESLAYDYPMIKAVSEGYLCPLRALTLPVAIDLRNEKPKNGDWSADQVASLLDPYLPELTRLYAENARDRKGLIFVPLCATGQKVQRALREQGLRAYYCSGEDRTQIKDWEADGPGSVMVNAMLLTEGYDHPPIDAIAVWRFTKSRPFFAQMCGRGTRLSPGKKNLLIIDNLFLTNRHELCRPASLFSDDEEIADAMQAAIDKDPGTDKALDEDLLDDGKADVIKAREEALMKQLIAMRGRKRELVDPLQYAASIGDPSLLAYEPTMVAEQRPVTQQQAELLAESGIYPGDIQSSGHADAILQQLEARRRGKMASPRQIRYLEKMGFKHVGQFQFKYSSMLTGRIRANGWRLPDDLAEKIRVQK